MLHRLRSLLVAGLGVAVFTAPLTLPAADVPVKKRADVKKRKDGKKKSASAAKEVSHEVLVPDESLLMPFKEVQPIYFVNRTQNAAEWEKLAAFWNEGEEEATDPRTGQKVTRKTVRVKVPLGLTSNPPVPAENPMTVQKWRLGKKLYFDGILCSDATVSCSSCHNPKQGYTDQSPVSTGISGQKGGMSAPTVMNSAYNTLQFWDGRALSLEHQAQGPPGNPVEMFDGKGHAWQEVVKRLRANPEYVKEFKAIFGTLPTQDAAAKAIAAYERTVLEGNSLHDRAELAMRKRIAEDDSGTAKPEANVKDYEVAIKDAIAKKDKATLDAVGLKDVSGAAELAKAIANGRALFFNKARCNSCHVGDNFTDNTFHNLGVGVKNGKLPEGALGRFGSLPTGAKNHELIGAFKTPTLRGLLSTGPYMHDGSERTLEQVVDFYDKGGNANEFLDVKMRDIPAEQAYLRGDRKPGVAVFNGKPIIPLKLNLTPQEKKDLVLFMRALQGEGVAAIVADQDR